jgi:hypothetical protein
MKRRFATLVSLAVLLSACRSAAPSARPGAPVAPDFLQAYVGQSRIVSGLSEAKGLTLDRRELGKPRPACDVAVAVREARFEGGALRLRLEVLGRPRLGQSQAAVGRRSKCATLPQEVPLAITGFAGEDAAAPQAALDQVLLTPEAFLQAHGVTFAPQAADDLKAVVASSDPTAPPERQALWRKLQAQPKPLLSVDADFQATAKRARFEGEVQFRSVVGVDGRLREVQVQGSLGADQEEGIKRVLKFWRFEPAKGPQGPVPAALESRLILRID